MPAQSSARRHRIARLTVVLAVIAALGAGFLFIGLPVLRSKDVAFYVGRHSVTQTQYEAMMEDLPFDKTSTAYGSGADLLTLSDSSTSQFLQTQLKNEAVGRFVVMYAEAAKASASGITITGSQLDEANKAYLKDHTTSESSAADIKALQTPEMKAYIELITVSKAYEEHYTDSLSVSAGEIRSYYNQYKPNYVTSTGKQLSLQQASKTVEADIRFNAMLGERERLLADNKDSVVLDTRYKQFLRWWDTMFGISIPDTLQTPSSITPQT